MIPIGQWNPRNWSQETELPESAFTVFQRDTLDGESEERFQFRRLRDVNSTRCLPGARRFLLQQTTSFGIVKITGPQPLWGSRENARAPQAEQFFPCCRSPVAVRFPFRLTPLLPSYKELCVHPQGRASRSAI